MNDFEKYDPELIKILDLVTNHIINAKKKAFKKGLEQALQINALVPPQNLFHTYNIGLGAKDTIEQRKLFMTTLIEIFKAAQDG